MNPYRSIQQIFYANKKFGIQEMINLQKYCLSNDLLRNICCESNENNINSKTIISNKQSTHPIIINTEEKQFQEKIEPPKIAESVLKIHSEKTISQISKPPFFEPIPIHPSKTMQPNMWIPPHKDTLFWCVFSEVYGHSEYAQIGNKIGNRVLEEKMKIANFFKTNPKRMKSSNHKFTNEGIQETIAEFMVDQSTSLKGLASLAVYYKYNIYILDEKRKLYLKFTTPEVEADSSKIYIYYHDFMRGEHKYKISMDEKNTNPSIEDWFCLENILKPLKPIGQYKVEDLYVIAENIGYEAPTKIKKTELYEALSEKCSWYNK